MCYCTLKKELTFTLSRLETNYVSFSLVKFVVFKAQPVFSKLSEAAPLDERDCISITNAPSLHYRTTIVLHEVLSCVFQTSVSAMTDKLLSWKLNFHSFVIEFG